MIGDYVAGVNHVLPTGGTARFADALRVDDFRKHVHVVSLEPGALARSSRRSSRRSPKPKGSPRTPTRSGAGSRHEPRHANAGVQPRDDLRSLEGYHSPQVDVPVRLNTNESPYAPPPEFVTRFAAALRDVDWHRYPDRGARELRDALGAFLGQPSERLLCANGSNEVLQTMLLTYGGPGRRALIFEPTYALHAHIARDHRAPRSSIGERGADFAIDADAAAALVRPTRPSVVFVCSPNNPTGTVEPARDRRTRCSRSRPRTAALLVVDEAYGEFAPWSALELVDDDRPLVVVRTYSKVWSLAAVRLGFAVAPAWVIAELEKVLLPYTLSVPTQIAGIVALDFRREMEQRVASLVEERGRLFAALADLPG